eukprot:COSAG02_NODE_48180_length_335_cov_1.292373_1_plen_74_part_10
MLSQQKTQHQAVYPQITSPRFWRVAQKTLAGEELAAALRDEDPTVTEEKLDRVMRILDTDGSGSISAAEFRLVL